MPLTINTAFCQAIAHLLDNGFHTHLVVVDGELFAGGLTVVVKDCQLQIQEMYYFPQYGGIGNDRMLYAVHVPERGIKGILSINGTYNIIAFINAINKKREEASFIEQN